MVRKSALLPLFLFLVFAVTAISSQAQTVKLKLHIVLIDRDLNQKPVPLFKVTLQPAMGTAIELKTGLDGTTEKSVPPGKYKLSTPQPIDFQGKRYSWSMDVTLAAPEQTVELTNDNAKTAEAAETGHAAAGSTDLTTLFDKFKNAVVKVRAEAHDGSGFLVDGSGLVVTNNHVVEGSTYLAVQFDQKRKVPAQLLAANADKDIAVLRVNLSAFPESVIAPLVPSDSASQLVVGERVFTIGNPLGREKVLTTGVISKVEEKSITSDININPGNSGGPLFNLRGQVTGITTAGLRTLASIVPIADAEPVIAQARQKLTGTAPSAELLPVEPTDYFPAEALRPLLQQEKMDTKPYFFDAGEFLVAVYTPPVEYFLRHKEEMDAARKATKRTSGDPAQAKPPATALEDAQDFRPVVLFRVRPKFGAFFKVRFKNGFQRMRLLCGQKEVTPIDPGRREFELRDFRDRAIDTTFQGWYIYPPDAVSPSCGTMSLEIYSEKSPNTPLVQPVDAGTVARVWADLEPYRKAHASK